MSIRGGGQHSHPDPGSYPVSPDLGKMVAWCSVTSSNTTGTSSMFWLKARASTFQARHR